MAVTMAEITKLRKISGAGMMDCKNALTEANGDIDKAMEIIRNYAATLEKIFPMDAPLCAGLQGFILVNAAEIMRYTYVEEHNENGWTYKDTEQTEDMFRNVFLPILSEFYKKRNLTPMVIGE